MNEEKKVNKKPEFSYIKDWLQEHLSKPNNLILANNTTEREVIINGIKGPVVCHIPVKTADNIEQFKEAWVDVYLGCLDYLNKYVSNLFLKDSLTLEDENTVLVGEQRFVFSNDMDSISYINTLERITIAYNALKKAKANENPISFKVSSVEISNPATMPIKTADAPIPNQLVSAKEVVDLEPSTVTITPSKNSIQDYFTCQKLSDDEVLSIADCKELDNDSIVFVTCTNLSKGENTFRDNIDTIIDNVTSIHRAAFISGKVIRNDQVNKEVSKIMKLCKGTIDSGVIMYEINNAAIQSMGEDYTAIGEALMSIQRVLDTLKENKYRPMICLDKETKKTIDSSVRYNFKYPTFLRVLPRELDEVGETDNLVIMDPQYDNDQVVVKNDSIVEYLGFSYDSEDQNVNVVEEPLAEIA